MKRNDLGPYSTQKKDQKWEEELPMGHLSGRVISPHYIGGAKLTHWLGSTYVAAVERISCC